MQQVGLKINPPPDWQLPAGEGHCAPEDPRVDAVGRAMAYCAINVPMITGKAAHCDNGVVGPIPHHKLEEVRNLLRRVGLPFELVQR